VSYDYRLPKPLRLHVTRIERNVERIGELEPMIVEFLAGVDNSIERLRSVAGEAALIRNPATAQRPRCEQVPG